MRSSTSEGQVQQYVLRVHRPGRPIEQRRVSVNTVHGEVGHFTRPFYDCGQTNQWMLQAVAMVSERMARSSLWEYLRRHTSVAASTVGVLAEALETNNSGRDVREPLSPARLLQGQNELAQQDVTSCPTLVTPNQPIPLSLNFWDASDLALTLEVQGRAGLRLSHFLSNFLQNNDFSQNERNVQIMNEASRNWRPGQSYPTFASPMIEVLTDRPLTYKQLASEVFATLMSNDNILGVGIFLDRGVFPEGSEPVSAFAWRGESGGGDPVGNVADLFQELEDYTAHTWFIQAKQSYAQISGTNSKSFSTGRQVRPSRTAEPRTIPEPVTYIATSYEQGRWLPPHFLCGPRQAGWAASYVSPILVGGSGGGNVRFGGVVKIDALFTAQNVSPN